jgi:hypothetical protein
MHSIRTALQGIIKNYTRSVQSYGYLVAGQGTSDENTKEIQIQDAQHRSRYRFYAFLFWQIVFPYSRDGILKEILGPGLNPRS